jgi:ABC-2 type transport system ATP-binding protein
MHELTMQNVTKRYGRATVVDHLSMTIAPGRVTGFLGPNGAGKSTSMKILLDLISADEGHAAIGGTRYRELRHPIRVVGAVLESNAFHPARSGRDHLRVLADGAGISRGRVDELLEQVDLAHDADRKVGGYSLGMRQRLGLAVALLGDPPVLVLDEPGNGLDPGGMRWLRDLLRARAGDGHTIFVSSHLLAEMEHLADDLVIIDKGALVTTGTVSDLLTAATSVMVRTPAADRMSTVLETAGAIVQREHDGSLLVRGLAAAEIGERAYAAGIPLHELASHAGSLEDMFLSWTGSAARREATPVPQREEVLV